MERGTAFQTLSSADMLEGTEYVPDITGIGDEGWPTPFTEFSYISLIDDPPQPGEDLVLSNQCYNSPQQVSHTPLSRNRNPTPQMTAVSSRML
jgi:hypothetical protein